MYSSQLSIWAYLSKSLPPPSCTSPIFPDTGSETCRTCLGCQPAEVREHQRAQLALRHPYRPRRLVSEIGAPQHLLRWGRRMCCRFFLVTYAGHTALLCLLLTWTWRGVAPEQDLCLQVPFAFVGFVEASSQNAKRNTPRLWPVYTSLGKSRLAHHFFLVEKVATAASRIALLPSRVRPDPKWPSWAREEPAGNAGTADRSEAVVALQRAKGPGAVVGGHGLVRLLVLLLAFLPLL